MSASEEAANPTVVDQPAAEITVKEKKPKAPKEKKPKATTTATATATATTTTITTTKTTVSHPPYFQMIKEALLALNEKGGSSPYAIAKYMEEKHKSVLPGNFKKILGLQLKNSAAKGKLIKIKASYKLSDTGKKENVAKKAPKKTDAAKKKPKQVKSAATKDGAGAKVKEVAKPAAVKKAVAKPMKKTMKKATPVKAKQPKSIKSPAAKRARKAVA